MRSTGDVTPPLLSSIPSDILAVNNDGLLVCWFVGLCLCIAGQSTKPGHNQSAAVTMASEATPLRIKRVVSGTVEGCDLRAFDNGVAFNELQHGHRLVKMAGAPAAANPAGAFLPRMCSRTLMDAVTYFLSLLFAWFFADVRC